MNQPTRDEFERLEAEQKQLKEEVRKLKEQQTEPIKVTIERRQADVERMLENHTEFLKEISSKQDEQGRQLGLLIHEVLVVKSEAQRFESKMDERFHAMEKRFESIAQVQALILARLPEKGE